MNKKLNEKGQALVIIALGAVVLFGFAALAIDGSMAFSDKRHAQNAADSAALAGALSYTRGKLDVDSKSAGQTIATANGYDNNGTSNVVTIELTPAEGCPGNALGKYIKVNIVSTVKTTLARVVGTTQITNNVTAIARGCGYKVAPLFGGNAIVSLNQTNNPCAFDSGDSNAAHWKIQGGGIFSNGCATSKNGTSVTLDPGECVSSVGTASNFTCSQQSPAIDPQEVLDIMPPNPCLSGGIGLPQSSGVTFGSSVTFGDGVSSKVYCITNMDALDSTDVILNIATLYVTDLDFNLKFAGGGGFSGYPSNSGDFANYYMVIAYKNPPCPDFTSNNAQIIQFRGNGTGTYHGTILAPSACLDLRGNGETDGIQSQIIGYNVSSNGNAEIYINYDEDENARKEHIPSITLWE